MRGEQEFQFQHCRDIERGERFIEYPQRHRGGEREPGQGHASALPLGQAVSPATPRKARPKLSQSGEHAREQSAGMPASAAAT